jgi:hypothetical protein
LPGLERLEIGSGVWHTGGLPSPFEPPFTGLPPHLKLLAIDAWEPQLLQTELQQLLPVTEVMVEQRYGIEPAAASWMIRQTDDVWHTCGSLFKIFDGKGGEGEYEAVKTARNLLRAEDPKLLARPDFDQESSGTAVAVADLLRRAGSQLPVLRGSDQLGRSRWALSHLHNFELADERLIGYPDDSFGPDMACRTPQTEVAREVEAGDEFEVVFDLGDS